MNLPKTLLRHFKPLIILVFGTLTAIGPDSSAAEPASPPPPVSKAKEPLPAPTHANVSYGPHTDHKIDLWLAKSSRPTPLILFIHGGGFVSGDKNRVSASAVREALDDGVSFASINYRFLFDASINEILRDTARALQFVRARAGDYNLDKRIAVYGSSAGAGASLWLAFHDELSDPNNA
ncbi:MAG: alpha/beta hydrolase, partial [Verrucomicrobiota bacterium]